MARDEPWPLVVKELFGHSIELSHFHLESGNFDTALRHFRFELGHFARELSTLISYLRDDSLKSRRKSDKVEQMVQVIQHRLPDLPNKRKDPPIQQAIVLRH